MEMVLPAQAFFFGLIAGQFATGGLWLVIDAFTGTVGNVIPVMF